jgi:hypothetical protein
MVNTPELTAIGNLNGEYSMSPGCKILVSIVFIFVMAKRHRNPRGAKTSAEDAPPKVSLIAEKNVQKMPLQKYHLLQKKTSLHAKMNGGKHVPGLSVRFFSIIRHTVSNCGHEKMNEASYSMCL